MKKQELLNRVRLYSRSTSRSELMLSLAAQDLSEKAVKARQAELSEMSKRIDKQSSWALVAVYVLAGALLVAWMGCTKDWMFSGPVALVLSALIWAGACVTLERGSTRVLWCTLVMPAVGLALLEFFDWAPHGTASDSITAFVMLMGAGLLSHGAKALAAVALNAEAIPAELDMLSSIAGTRSCLGVVDNLKEGGKHATAWRDLAIAERGQLLRLDAEIIAALAGLHVIETARNDRQASLDAACREAHGLA